MDAPLRLARGGYVVKTPEKMPAKIRLRRTGRKKKAHYRVVVADSASPRDGRFVETLGYYKPLSHPARLVLNLERVDYWLGEGAQPSATMKSLIAKARRGGDAKVALGEVDPEERKSSRAEKLAARRAVEQKAEQEAAATEKAASEAEAEEEPAPEAESAEETEEEAGDEPAAEQESEPAAEAGADADAEEADAEEKSE
jgi:small subunit ribosomal protein S16